MTITPASSRPSLSRLGERIYEQMAPMQFGEAEQGYALARYITSLATLLDPVDEVVNEDGEHAGWEIAASPELCPDWLLSWLSMWSGVLYTKGRSEADARYLIQNSPAHLRGTRSAIENAVKSRLSGGKNVYFSERDPSAYDLVVFTWQHESPETDWKFVNNLVPNPSAEVSATNSIASSNCVLSRDTALAAPGAGAACWRLVANATAETSDVMHVRSIPVPVTPGETYTASAYFRSDAVPRNCRIILTWVDPSETWLAESESVLGTTKTDEWIRLTITAEAPTTPAGVTHSQVLALYHDTAMVEGEVHFVDGMSMIEDDESPAYADGDTPGWDWEGTPHNSVSERAFTHFVENAAKALKPAGITLRYEVRIGQFYSHVEEKHETYADVEAAYDDYAEMLETKPF